MDVAEPPLVERGRMLLQHSEAEILEHRHRVGQGDDVGEPIGVEPEPLGPVVGLAVKAGVALSGETLAVAVGSPLTWGVVVGLTVGKLMGVTAGTWLALRSGIGIVPDTLHWGQLVGGAGLSGIGFTVALFVTRGSIWKDGTIYLIEAGGPRELVEKNKASIDWAITHARVD